ncbi:MAG: hypothetical protein NTX24_02080 [Candidatus Pacearchaeota archaeon]|nr:hypothetical protein [Candidatus Pacearchaeota archaeon]
MVENKKLFGLSLLLVLTLTLTLILLPLTLAEINVETVIETNTVCPSSTIVIVEKVTSTVQGTFSVSFSGSASSFSTVVPTGFFLSSGQEQDVVIYITPSSKTSPGVYSLSLQISGAGSSKTITQGIVVENCHQTTISVDPYTQTMCSCDEKSYALKISNTGKYLENYVLTPQGPVAQYVTLSNNMFSLQPNSFTEVTAYIRTPCDFFGNYDLTFKLSADSKYAQAETTSKVEVIPCYDYSLTTEKNLYEMCENEKIIVPIKLKNLGTAPNTYSIKLTGPAWVQSDQKSITLSAQEEKTFSLIIQPPFKTQGNFTLRLETSSGKGKIIKDVTIDLKSDACYDASVVMAKETDSVCNTLTSTYSAAIKNLGRFKGNFDIKLEAPVWVKIDKTAVSLDAGNETTVLITVNPPADTKSTDYSIIIKAIDQLSKTEYQDSMSIKTMTSEECYKPFISSQEEEVDVYQDGAATFAFAIENKGIKDAEYAVEISGNAAQFARVNPTTVQIPSGKAQTLYLYLSPSIDMPIGAYTVNIAARLKDTSIVSSKTITVNVLKCTEEQSVNKTNQTAINATKKGFFESIFQSITGFFIKLFSTKPISQTNATNITNISAGHDVCSLTNLSCEIQVENKTTVNTTNETNETGGNLITGNVVNNTNTSINATSCNDYYWFDSDNSVCSRRQFCGLYMYEGLRTFSTLEECENNLPKSENQTEENETNTTIENQAPKLAKKIPNLYLVSGGNVTIDLSKYFSDPEDDHLEYMTVKPVNLSVMIRGSLITINSPENFTGIRDITFYATDGNTMIQSNTVNITVSTQPVNKPIDLAEFFVQYKSYIIGALIIALLIIILFSGIGKKILDFFEEDVEEEKKKKE